MSGSDPRPTRKELRLEARRQREELLRRRRRSQRLRKLASVLLVVAALAGIAGFYVFGRSEDNGAAAPPAGVESFEVTSRNHVDGVVEYPQDPPVGGDHSGVWQNCGFYDAPIAKENAVHSLEHGAAWITYRPDLSEDQLDALRTLAGSESFILVTPYPGQQTPVVASAWGRQLSLGSATDPDLEGFVRSFMVGPTTPEPGAPCTGGIGEPS